MKQQVLALVVSLTLPVALVQAAEHSYSYLEAGAIQRALEHDDSGHGYAVAGSLAVSDAFHGFASYQRSDHDLADLSYGRVGFGYRLDVNEDWDLLARISYETADFDFIGDADGYGIEVAARGALGPNLDLEVGARRRDLEVESDIICIAIFPPPRPCAFAQEQDGSETRAFANLHWRFAEQWGLVVSGEAGNKHDQVFIGPRWSF